MMLLLSIFACAPPDACERMCGAAQSRYESCMAERGLAWGDAYADAADYQDWCQTWGWEARQLGEADRCEAMQSAFTDGDCEAYDNAW